MITDKDNSLYLMIRMRAGTEMLQKAEEIIMYINVEN